MTKPVYVKNLEIGDGFPKICVPVTGKTEEEILKQAADAVKAGADLVEWRADLWEEENRLAHVEEILFALDGVLREKPLLFTVRSSEEGGNLCISTEDQVALINRAAASGRVDLADVETMRDPDQMAALVQALHRRDVKVIASSHDFKKTGTRENLIRRLKMLENSGADILKIAVMPENEADVDVLMEAVYEYTRTMTTRPVIAMAMGETGKRSRIEGERFGSAVTFGTVGASSAPGQLPIEELRTKTEAVHSAV